MFSGRRVLNEISEAVVKLAAERDKEAALSIQRHREIERLVQNLDEKVNASFSKLDKVIGDAGGMHDRVLAVEGSVAQLQSSAAERVLECKECSSGMVEALGDNRRDITKLQVRMAWAGGAAFILYYLASNASKIFGSGG